MIEDDNNFRIKAWGPLKIFLFDYIAPDVMTAGIVYLSMFHAFFANLILNHIAVFFLPSQAPEIFKYTLAGSILYGCIFALTKLKNYKGYEVALYRDKMKVQIVLFPVLAIYIFCVPFLFLNVGMQSGFVPVYVIYCLIHPFLFCLAITFITSMCIADVLRLIKRYKK